jgi:hypothetical protein
VDEAGFIEAMLGPVGDDVSPKGIFAYAIHTVRAARNHENAFGNQRAGNTVDTSLEVLKYWIGDSPTA